MISYTIYGIITEMETGYYYCDPNFGTLYEWRDNAFYAVSEPLKWPTIKLEDIKARCAEACETSSEDKYIRKNYD